MSAQSFEISVTIPVMSRDAVLVAPLGMDMSTSVARGVDATGGRIDYLTEPWSRQRFLKVTPRGSEVVLTYFYEARPARYPTEIFCPRESRFTRAAQALLDEASAMAPLLPPVLRAQHIACRVAEKFTYGHPQDTFTDGLTYVPKLGCDVQTPGSCIDINTYFLASLRAAGIEAGYVLGYFFPAEKRDHCEDAHCWVVTRINGQVQEWDIAHHLKLGTREIAPGTNPKPGFRAAVSHSMGLDLPELGLFETKLIGQPVWVAGGAILPSEPQIHLTHPSLAA